MEHIVGASRSWQHARFRPPPCREAGFLDTTCLPLAIVLRNDLEGNLSPPLTVFKSNHRLELIVFFRFDRYADESDGEMILDDGIQAFYSELGVDTQVTRAWTVGCARNCSFRKINEKHDVTACFRGRRS